MDVLSTRGPEGKRKKFTYTYDQLSKKLIIRNSEGREDLFELPELIAIVQSLFKQFQFNFFPLANNVELLGRGTEQPGLGKTILDLRPGDIKHAQASSYLGVVLEDIGIFKWNGVNRGIKWRIILPPEEWRIEERLVASAKR
jgi:hypothetical protein